MVTAQTCHEGVQGGQVVGFNGAHLAVEALPAEFAHHRRNAATCRRAARSAGQRRGCR
ncbi:hypothetical protein [Krasilnikovia sp. M28-CT-15]|uniref:hypothetical protein n=1 Tax=Krasilnikovia sp. M28-CT-15 TaxID=3373540 RepID=UPI00399D34AC